MANLLIDYFDKKKQEQKEKGDSFGGQQFYRDRFYTSREDYYKYKGMADRDRSYNVRLSGREAWKRTWGFLLFVSIVSLLVCFIIYSYQTFSSAVFSRVSVESSVGQKWPTVVVCERKAFSRLNMEGLEQEFTSYLNGDQFKGDYNKLLDAIIPKCSEFIIQCQVGRSPEMNGTACCSTIFNTRPFLTQQGTCFSTRGRGLLYERGVARGFEDTEVFVLDQEIASPDLLSSSGISFSVVESNISPYAAVRKYSHPVEPDTVASVGLSSTVVDNKQLELTLIGRASCHDASDEVSSHLNKNQGEFGYSRENCRQGKEELLATKLFGCTFALTDSSVRYTVSPSITGLSESFKQSLKEKVPAGASVNAIVLKLFLTSTDYTMIENKPQPFLQFIAEVGGMMAFFLGLSVITLIECCCYCAFWTRRQCTSDDEMSRIKNRPKPPARHDPPPERRSEERWTEQYKQELQMRAAELEARSYTGSPRYRS